MADEYDDEFSGFANTSPDDIERRAAAGGTIPAGWYHAKLTGAKRVTSREKSTPGWEMTFTITNGLYEGREVSDTLWISDANKDRIGIFGKRLGLLVPSADGKGLVKAEGKRDFVDVLDTPCVIEVNHQADRNDPAKKYARVAYTGVYPPTHADAVAGLAGKKGGAKSGTGAAASPPPPPPPAASSKRDVRKL